MEIDQDAQEFIACLFCRAETPKARTKRAFWVLPIEEFGCGGRICPVRVLKQSTGLFYRALPERPLTLQVMVSFANDEL
ncbi:hypothetical protein K6M90_17485, partial [Rhizobium sp. 9T]|uniref:hypothetical protein n=1 Tax=Rhizobium croatiense TaxID=2867516 RepID=UPI001C93648B